jgi:hypothetical protein
VAKTTRRTTLGAAKKLGFRSGLEVKVAEQLSQSGVSVEYETTKIKYVVPESVHTYTPDFVLPNGIVVETKGRFTLSDRKKHLLIQKQHPDKDIRFVFTNSNNKISKGSKTSYADWCRKNNFIFADKKVPDEWLT